tara:strand:+ start:2631 stop:2768 length:138 start_codon:yes stop_codon:yes gene_type:complete
MTDKEVEAIALEYHSETWTSRADIEGAIKKALAIQSMAQNQRHDP